MKIGEVNRLKVIRETPHGLYLGLDGDEETVLLPGKYLTGNEKDGDELDVFIYNDSEDRLVATTQEPKIKLNEFAALEVVDVNRFGVFVDWGLDKDLLVPFKEQNKKMQKGNTYVLRMYLDDSTDRLVATSKVKKFLSNEDLKVKENDKVDLLVFNRSELGYDVIINDQYQGLVYQNEVNVSIGVGDRLTGYIHHIREDKKIDVRLQPVFDKDETANTILKALKEHGGELPLSDKSSPEAIYNQFGMSKKVFKKAIGVLYRQRAIIIEKDGIKLT